MKVYVFREHDPTYRNFFKLEKRRLLDGLGKCAAVEHVGSTAVPGLGGKNILDIAVGLKCGSRPAAKAVLENMGYEFRPSAGTRSRLFFRKSCLHGRRMIRVHLHLVRFEGREWNEMLAFRDYLAMNRSKMLEYAAVKRRAAESAKGDKVAYRAMKEGFILYATKSAMKLRH